MTHSKAQAIRIYYANRRTMKRYGKGPNGKKFRAHPSTFTLRRLAEDETLLHFGITRRTLRRLCPIR